MACIQLERKKDMTDAQFRNELWILCYIDQIDGYPIGDPGRTDFRPIVPLVERDFLNREKTLKLSSYAGKFTPEDLKILLKKD